MTIKDILERPFQQRNCDGSWGPLIINGMKVDYEGYPHKPAPSTIEAIKQYDEVYPIKPASSTIEAMKQYDEYYDEGHSKDSKITCTAHEDCNGTTYYQRGYYENLPNGGFKWIDCGSSYNIHGG